VLVKELQGLGLKVDLVTSNKVVDAEEVLATSIRDEAAHLSEVEVPAPAISDVDVTEETAVDEFMVMEGDVTDEEENIPVATVAASDDDDDLGGDDFTVDEEETDGKEAK
jgi:hypothetical protein